MTVVLESFSLSKSYGTGNTAVRAVDGVSARFRKGEFTAVMGPSGSGKTTMMQVLAGLDRPTSGHVEIDGRDLNTLTNRELTDLRRDRIGFIFQAFNLLPSLTAQQNIMLPWKLAGRRPEPEFFDEIVTSLGLADRLSHRPGELSGGQQQRVAVARALLTRPAVIFADEPTGALDLSTGRALLARLRAASKDLGQTVLMVTHDPAAATYADRVLLMADGQLRGELRDPNQDTVLAAMKQHGEVPVDVR